MNLYNEIVRCDKFLINYMDQVKLYENDFRILDRYRGFLEIVQLYELSLDRANRFLTQMFKEKEMIMFDSYENYILNSLKQNVIEFYIKEKPAYEVTMEYIKSIL